MKRSALVLFLLLVLSPLCAHAQEQNKTFGIGFSGFVKTDFFMDTRQTVSSREGHFLLLPAPENMDARGEDINGAPVLKEITSEKQRGMKSGCQYCPASNSLFSQLSFA